MVKGLGFNINKMTRFIFVAILVAVTLEHVKADHNHQEQDFGTCGHRLSKTECDAYAVAHNKVDSTEESDATKPYGCYIRKSEDAYYFNTDNTGPDCSTEFPCICDKLVGSFDPSSLVCNSQGFQPTFTYNPHGQTQHVDIEITIGTGAHSNGDADNDCIARTSGQDANLVVTDKADFGTGFTDQIPFGTTGDAKCGGTLSHVTLNEVEKIQYEVSVKAIVTRNFRDSVIHRKNQFLFSVKCLLARDVTQSTTSGFTVEDELIVSNEEEEVSRDFSFAATLKFYGEGYSSEENGKLAPKNNEKVYVEVAKGDNQDLFVFSVQNCYATTSQSLLNYDGPTDIFLEEQCPTDETVDFSVVDKKFRFEIQAFTFTASPSETIYLHCDLRVCLNDGTDSGLDNGCAQKAHSECDANLVKTNRRRREVTFESIEKDGFSRETVTSSSPILLEGSKYHAPECGGGFVYDRIAEECTRSNLIEVKDVRLATTSFEANFYNTSSKAYREMVREKEYLIWVLVKASGDDNIIRGVQVTKVHPGPGMVMELDVAIRHTASVTSDHAYKTFKKIMQVPATTIRVQKVLQIAHDNAVQYMSIIQKEPEANNEKVILIVLFVVLFAVLFIAAVTMYKIRQNRQRESDQQPAAGFDNKAVEA